MGHNSLAEPRGPGYGQTVRRFVAIGVAAVALVASAVCSASGSPMPDKYRFTGWMAAGQSPSDWPTHLLVEGDAGTLRFADRWNLARKPVAYRVCVSKSGSAVVECRGAKAAIGGHPSLLPVFVRCCGDFVTRWYVAGRLVAMWPFRFIPELATP